MFDISHAPLSDRQALLPYLLAVTNNTNIFWAESFHCLQSQKDLGFVLNPGEGPISAVALYVPAGAAVPTHLFSGGVDGTLAVWSAGRTWDCLKVNPPPPPLPHLSKAELLSFVKHVLPFPFSNVCFNILRHCKCKLLLCLRSQKADIRGRYLVWYVYTDDSMKLSAQNIACDMAFQGQPMRCQVQRKIFV